MSANFFRLWPLAMSVAYAVGSFIQWGDEKIGIIFAVWFAATCIIYSRKEDRHP